MKFDSGQMLKKRTMIYYYYYYYYYYYQDNMHTASSNKHTSEIINLSNPLGTKKPSLAENR